MKISGGIKGLAKTAGLKLVLGLFFVSALMTLLVSEAANFQMNNYETTVTVTTQDHLLAAVHALAGFISAEELDRIHTLEDTYTQEYEDIKQRLIKFGEDYDVLYAFYWRDYGNGDLQYIVDNDLDPQTIVGPWVTHPMDEKYLNALADKSTGVTDLGAYIEPWPGLISAWTPVYDKDGDFYCFAGVDISDKFIIKQKKDSTRLTILQLIVLPVSILFGILNMLLYRRKAKQIEEAHIKLQYFNNNLRRAFSTYLSEDVVEEIISDPAHLQLGGEKRFMTALFTDVRNFSGITERLTPEHLVELLNYYLSTMSDIILEQDGTIDKYQGDTIVSFFGAPVKLPDHALRACITAIMMKRIEPEVNNYLKENELSPSPLHTRMGINSGDMVVGNMGTQKKMNYTIVSNAVNLAARLEGVNKQYGTWILASEDTIKETQGRLLCRRLDRIRVVGINEPVRIYEILEIKEDAPAELLNRADLFHKAHELFEGRSWKEAADGFNRLLELFSDDKPSLLYRDRCLQYLEYPPPDNWDGVYNFEEK